MPKVCISILTFTIFLSLNVSNALADCIPSSEADSVVLRMVKKYQSFIDYRDTGNVLSGVSDTKFERTFKTKFEAPDKFTFEWVEKDSYFKSKHYKVWGENQTAFYSSWGSENVEKLPTSKALSAAHGVSGGVAFQVLPWMLFQQDPCKYIGRTNNKIINNEKYQGNDAFVIKRSKDSDNYNKIWVEKETLLLRKIETHNFYKNTNFISVIQFENIEYK